MMSKGAVLIARNNGQTDYVKQAVFLAKRIKKYLGIPTSIITDSPDYLKSVYGVNDFDKVISIGYTDVRNLRVYNDGSMSQRVAQFKNDVRAEAYSLSPYDQTLLLDTDYIISNNILLNCFDSEHNLMMFKKSEDIAKVRDEREFDYISDASIDFYWATVVYFKKTEENEIFFNLIKHIQKEWIHYRRVYQIGNALYRNDFAFSIAVHIMNGFEKGTFCQELPGKHLYTIDKDLLWDLNEDKMLFLVEKKDYLGEYTPISTKGQNIHVMNKFSLERIINQELHNG